MSISETRPSDFILEQWQRGLRVATVEKPDRFPAKLSAEIGKKRRRLSDAEIDTGRRDIQRALARATTDRFACEDKHWCVARMAAGPVIVIALNGGYTGIACDLADIVITPARLKWDKCKSGAMLFTGETLRRTGSLEIYLTQSDYAPPTIRVVGALDGERRQWTQHRRYDWRADTFADAN